MRIGSRLAAREDFLGGEIRQGDTGVYTRADDYVPGWDAGIHEVTLDNPRGRGKTSRHWTGDEVAAYWVAIPCADGAHDMRLGRSVSGRQADGQDVTLDQYVCSLCGHEEWD